MSWLDGVWRALLSVCNMGGQWWNVFSLPSMRQFRFHEKLSEPPWSVGWVTPFSWGCPYPKWCSLVIRLWLRNCGFLMLDYSKTVQLKPIWDDARFSRFSISFFSIPSPFLKFNGAPVSSEAKLGSYFPQTRASLHGSEPDAVCS